MDDGGRRRGRTMPNRAPSALFPAPIPASSIASGIAPPRCYFLGFRPASAAPLDVSIHWGRPGTGGEAICTRAMVVGILTTYSQGNPLASQLGLVSNPLPALHFPAPWQGDQDDSTPLPFFPSGYSTYRPPRPRDSLRRCLVSVRRHTSEPRLGRTDPAVSKPRDEQGSIVRGSRLVKVWDFPHRSHRPYTTTHGETVGSGELGIVSGRRLSSIEPRNLHEFRRGTR